MNKRNFHLLTTHQKRLYQFRFTSKSDYSQKLWNGKLGLGYKVAMVHTDNTFNFFNIEVTPFIL
ncbi:MAG: hypothetical protein R2847_09175 [Bacteroidia bacterium]